MLLVFAYGDIKKNMFQGIQCRNDSLKKVQTKTELEDNSNN